MAATARRRAPLVDPPGSLGAGASVDSLRTWLTQLEQWRRGVTDALDAVGRDTAVMPNPGAYQSDLELAMALEHSVSEKAAAIVALWDSGRVDPTVSDRISQAVFGRLDGAAIGTSAVSFAEACTLLDALTDRLQQRLAADDPVAHVRAEVAARVALLEVRRADLARRVAATNALVARTRSRIVGAPQPALPDPDVVAASRHIDTSDPARAQRELDQYAAELDDVDARQRAAFGVCAPLLAERDELRGLVESYAAMAAARGAGENVAVERSERAARDVLWSAPCDLAIARDLVARHQQCVRDALRLEEEH